MSAVRAAETAAEEKKKKEKDTSRAAETGQGVGGRDVAKDQDDDVRRQGEQGSTGIASSLASTSRYSAPDDPTIPGTPAPADALAHVPSAALTRPLPASSNPFSSTASTTGPAQLPDHEKTPTKGTWNTSIAARLAPDGDEDVTTTTTMRKRQTGKGRLAESVESVSTDGEWEKVEEGEGEI